MGEVHKIVGQSTRNGKYHLRDGKYRRVSVVMGVSNGLGDGDGDGDGKEFERGVQVPLCRVYYGGVHEICIASPNPIPLIPSPNNPTNTTTFTQSYGGYLQLHELYSI